MAFLVTSGRMKGLTFSYTHVVDGSIPFYHEEGFLVPNESQDESQDKSQTESPQQGAIELNFVLVLLFALLFPSFGTWIYFFVLGDHRHVQLVYTLSKVVQFSFPIVWIFLTHSMTCPKIPLRIGPGRYSEIARNGILSGLFLSTLILIVWLLVLRGHPLTFEALPRIREKLEVFGAATPAAFIGLALFFSFLHSALEEYYWRWFVFGSLRSRLSLTPSASIASLGFALHHGLVLWAWLPAPLAFTGGVAVALAGALWCWQADRPAGLGSAWLSHALVDLTLFAIGWDLFF